MLGLSGDRPAMFRSTSRVTTTDAGLALVAQRLKRLSVCSGCLALKQDDGTVERKPLDLDGFFKLLLRIFLPIKHQLDIGSNTPDAGRNVRPEELKRQSELPRHV